MLLRRTTTAILTYFARHFSSTKPFSKIPWKHRSKAIKESQKSLTDYLHSTRSLPFLYADNIVRNSLRSLWKIVSKIPFSPPTFSYSFQRFLRYHPISELEFFFESIGLNCEDNRNPHFSLPPNTLFLADCNHFDVACALAEMGFPWSKLGLLCKDEFSVLESNPLDLKRMINEIKDGYGFNSVTLISICLSFPRVLYIDNMDGLLSDLKILFVDNDLRNSVEGGNVDDLYDVCEKIRTFYDLGCEMGNIGELMARSKNIFIEYSKDDLISTFGYFCNLNVRKDHIGVFLLSRPEIFGFDLESPVISVSGFLEKLGLNEIALKSLKHKYPYAFGRNRVANLPSVMKSMNLGEWFFEKMKNGSHFLLDSKNISRTDDSDEHYEECLRKTLGKRTHVHAIKKLNFLHSIGFGENKFSVKALCLVHSSNTQLQKRFDCLLRCGIEYSKLCAMVNLMPKILNQQEKSLEEKIEYLCIDIGSSLDYLDVFPGYLCYDLEKRIKPRCEFDKWLLEKGLCKKEYSLSTIVASSEKAYVARLMRISRDVAKTWEDNRADQAVS